jgi:hypothetical protein
MADYITVIDDATNKEKLRPYVPGSPATPTPRFSRQSANAGVWVTFGTIAVQIPTSGNRSLQIRSASGSISVAYLSYLDWNAPPAWTTITVTPTSTTYLVAGWSFTAANQIQMALIHDTTNNRAYRVIMQIGAAYNNNIFSFEEVT